MTVEEILRKAAAEIRAANINGWGNACEGGADRIRELESQMRGQTFQTPDEKDARIGKLEAALGKAVDTFEDIAQVARLLRHSGVAEAARIASVHCREVLATAETKGESMFKPLKDGLCITCGRDARNHDFGGACRPGSAMEDLAALNRGGKHGT